MKMKALGGVILLLGLLFAFAAARTHYAHDEAQPVAPPEATVIFDRARFTILTPALIRMELQLPSSSPGVFDDRPTFSVINRRLPVVPAFTTTYPDPNMVVITTDLLRITFQRPGPSERNFTADNLRVDLVVAGKPTSWVPGTADPANLNGTCAEGPSWPGGLDCYSTPAQCVQRYNQLYSLGLVSRSGWAVHDDTLTPRFQAQDPKPGELRWFDLTNGSSDAAVGTAPQLRVGQDLYFLGHGHAYVQALQDWSMVSGPIALPPQSAFGVWWSRYYPYSDQSFIKEVMIPYTQNDLPLNHAVLDMDWHIEPPAGTGCNSWGGYTFNATLFPDPVAFIDYLHSVANIAGHPVKLSLNLHPQTGVDHCQTLYPEVAEALGTDPKTLATVPCNYDNQTYSDVMFKMVMGSSPLSGVDYWWTDYGGCSNSLDPAPALWWTNYLFVEHMNVAGKLRPLLLSRYGGIGSQRLPIGFSGDTFQDYGTLEYEIQMTPTSSNVLFAYWSHDIGGNHNGTDCPGTDNPLDLFGMELLVRWLQFAAVSPIWRTHCSCDRYFWTFPYFDIMRQAFHLRNALGPYIYTSARQAYDTAVGLVHPLYYEWPEEDGAYAFRDQYMFGPDVLAAPIARPSDEITRRVAKDVWLPPGRWVSWDGATVFDGPHVVSRADWTLADLPLYARAGAVIPMKTMASVATMTPVNPLVWVIFFSAGGPLSGRGRLYEDDGVSLAYTSRTLAASWATTEVDYLSSPAAGTVSITIGAMTGGFAGAPTSRAHVLQLRGPAQPPQSVTCNGVVVPKAPGPGVVPGWYVEGTNATSPLLSPAGSLVISLIYLPVAQPAAVVLKWW